MVRRHPLPLRQRLIIFRRRHTSLWHIVPHPQVFFFRTHHVDRAEHRSALGVKMSYFEMIFVQFLHLLAHHPDFSLTQESLPDMAKCVYFLPFTRVSSYMIFGTRYIEFYLESVASAENISLLYHLSGKAKTVRDSESHLYSEVRWPVYFRKAEA
jgi:sister-chromatid-cohesion protein PDS5